MFCERCTLLQRQEDIPYQIDFNFEGRYFELPYFPVFLPNKNLDHVTANTCLFFSLQAINYLLKVSGYAITQAFVRGEILVVAFDKATPLQKLETFEELKRLDNKFTYFLYAIKQDKNK